MKAFLITALCATLAFGKPQYNYPAPSIPSNAFLGGGGGISGGGLSGSGLGGGGFIGGIGASSSSGGGVSGGTQGFTGVGFGAASGGAGGVIGGGGTLVQKHIYVHVAPPEPEEVRTQTHVAGGQATKHYKIIFIKAPSYPSYQQQILQAQAQNEEKTLVYVLVKKPDDVADITLPTAAPTAPSKPEVYFIRYKAKSEVAGGGAVGGTHLGGSGIGIGSGPSLGVSTSSGSNIGLTSVARPSSNYGPPGQSGPY